MNRKQRAPYQDRGPDVEDSVQYLRRYLDDVGPVPQQQSYPLSPSGNNNNGAAAAGGVLPPSAISSPYSAPLYAEARGAEATVGMRHASGTPRHTTRGRLTSPTRDTWNDDRCQFSWRSNTYTRASSLRNDERFLEPELHNSWREHNGRGAASLHREPLRLSYTSSFSNSTGRPPLYQLHHQEQQQQQRNSLQRGNMTNKWTGMGLRGREDVSSSRGEMKDQKWRFERGDNFSEDQNGSLNRSRRSYADSYEVSADCVRNGGSSYHHDRSSYRNLLGGDARHDREGKEAAVREELTNQKLSSNNISEAMPGIDVTPRRKVTDDCLPCENKAATACLGSSLREARVNDVSSASGNPAYREFSGNVFPYQTHEDNVRVIISYLKNQYALEPEEYLRGIETMTPEDALGLAQCFYVDVYRTVRHARSVAGVGLAGFTEEDPDINCVVDSPRNCETQVSTKLDERSHIKEPCERRKMKKDKVVATTPPLRQKSPSNDLASQNELQQHPSQQAAVRELDAANMSRRTCPSSSPPSHVPQVNSVSEATNNGLTEGTSPLPDQQPNSNKGIVRRPLKELMVLLRRGSSLCKYVESGCPHMRFFRVEDKLGVYNGNEMLMPHLVWYPGTTDKRPSGVLPLISLVGVHLLVADNSSSFRKLFRRKKGVVTDNDGRSVANDMCVVFRFKGRDVAVSFLAEEDRQIWVGGMMGIVEKNKEMLLQTSLQ